MEWVAGVDEAGRGPLAGPVVVAAVILDPARRINNLKDSKLLEPQRREVLARRIRARARAWSVITVEVAEVDRLNILYATMAGMQRAVAALNPAPVKVLVDGDRAPAFACPATAEIGGDRRIRAISAASILAKVARDEYMCALDSCYPGYGFSRHKGYATPEHLFALQRLGPCPEHRRSFAPIRALLQGNLDVLTACAENP